MKIVLMGYHNIGCIVLKALLRHNIHVPAVITHRDKPDENIWFRSLRNVAINHAVRVCYSEDYNNEGLYKLINELQPDLIFSAYYRHLIPERILNIAKYGGVNIHGSYLPKYRGRVPVNWQIINGETEGGVTLHYMTKKADAGNVIAQKKIKILDNDTPTELFKKIEERTIEMLEEELSDIDSWKQKAFKQNHDEATVFKGRKPEDGLINWLDPSNEIYNLIRGITKPYPGAYSFIGDKIFFIWESVVKNNFQIELNVNPGEITKWNQLILVKTGNGFIELKNVSLSNDHLDYKNIVANKILEFGNHFLNKSEVLSKY